MITFIVIVVSLRFFDNEISALLGIFLIASSSRMFVSSIIWQRKAIITGLEELKSSFHVLEIIIFSASVVGAMVLEVIKSNLSFLYVLIAIPVVMAYCSYNIFVLKEKPTVSLKNKKIVIYRILLSSMPPLLLVLVYGVFDYHIANPVGTFSVEIILNLITLPWLFIFTKKVFDAKDANNITAYLSNDNCNPNNTEFLKQ